MINGISINELNLSTGASETNEPLRQYNFTFEVDTLPSVLVRKFPLPTVGNEEIAIPYGNETVYIAGKAKFEAGELSIMDDVDSNAFKYLLEWRNKVYDPQTGNINLAGKYKKDATVKQYMPDGRFVRAWKLKGCWITSLKPGDLDQDGTSIISISATIRYDKAWPEQ